MVDMIASRLLPDWARRDVQPSRPQSEPLIASPTRPELRLGGSSKTVTVSVDNSDNGPDVTRRSGRSPWSTSAWLWRSTLSSFIVLFTVLWVSLIVIWRIIHEQNGFRLTITSNHYAWTYGPTAVLVIVASMWRQVDYHTKAAQPWHAMGKAFTPASKSLLLDYVSPIQFSSFAMALKHRHWSVVISIACFATLKAVILVSAGLFLPLPTSTAVEVPITVTNAFDGTDFWTRTNPVPYSAGAVNVTTSTPYQAIVPNLPQNVAYTLNISGAIFTNLERLQNATVPEGVKNNVVFQSFFTAQPGKNLSSVSYTVDAFVPAISCETAMTSWYKPDGRSSTVNFALDTTACSVGHENQQGVTGSIDLNMQPYQNYTESYTVQRVNCSNRNASDVGTVFLNNNTPAVYQLAFLVVNFTNEQYQSRNDPNNPNATLIDATPQTFAAAICDVDYTMAKALVTYDFGNNQTSVLVQDQPVTNVYLSNLTKVELMEILYDGLSEAPGVDMDFYPGDPTGFLAASGLLYKTMTQTLAGNQSLARFFDAEILNSAAQTALSGLAAQFMASDYLMPASLNETGSATLVELKLHLGEMSLWLMVAGLMLLSAMTLTMLMITQRSMAPRGQSLIAIRAALLTSNPAIQTLFAGSGGMDLEGLRQKFEGYQFRTSFSAQSLSVIPKRPVASAASSSSSQAKHPKCNWTPYAGRRHAIVLILLSPVLAIVVLEVLYRLSQQGDGICTTNGNSSAVSYVIRYSSTLTVLLIATLYNCLDFAAADIAPYSAMRSHHETAKRSILCDLLGSLPPVALFDALRARHIGSALTSLAALVGSFLTVIVSGLWIIDTFVPHNYSVQASLNNTWDVGWLNSSYNDNGAATTLSKLYYGEAIPPANIWKNLVLPDLRNVSTSTGAHGQSIVDSTNHLNYTFHVPALRPQLSCHIISPEKIAIDYQGYDSGPNDYATVVEATIDLPKGCLTGPYGNVSNLVIHEQYNSIHADSSGWYGQFNDLHMGPWNASIPEFGSWGEYSTPSQTMQPDSPAGCPSLAALFGYWGSNRSTVENVTGLWCAQNVEQVSTLVTYTGDPESAQLSTSHPPAPVESSVRNLTNGLNGPTGFPYRVSAHWVGLPKLNPDFSDNVDNFFGYLIYGPGGTQKEDLVGSENAGRLIERMNEVYQSYMVQVINANFRVEPSGSTDSTLDGEATSFVNRLKVNQGSKITLQIMLGTMLGLGAVAYCLVDLRGTLPCEPCSIGATLSLLADSELCDRLHLPVGSEFMSKKELDHVLAGMRFGLGWWRHRGAGRHDAVAEAGANASPAPQRFGIDIGIPNVAGFDEKSGLRLGSRMHRRKKRAGQFADGKHLKTP